MSVVKEVIKKTEEETKKENDGPIKFFNISIEENAKYFCGLVEGLSKMFGEINLHFNNDGIQICEIDEGRIGLMRLFIDKRDFEVYEISENFKWSVEISDLNKILKRFSKNDTKIEILENSDKSVMIRMSNDEIDDTPREFVLDNITFKPDELNVQAMENLRYTAHIEIPLGKFSRLLKDVELYSETIELHTVRENDVITAIAEGYTGDFKQNIPNRLICLDDIKKDFKSVWSLEYMKIFERIGKCFGTVASKSFKEKGLKLHLKYDTPLKGEFELFGNSSIKFWIAPRLEEESNEDWDEED